MASKGSGLPETLKVKEEYKWANVQGVKAIVWMFTNKKGGKLSNKEVIRRQQLKQKVGRVHLDTVMLDTKSKGSNRIYCDIIIFSNNIGAWELVIKDHFNTLTQKVRGVNGGHQIVFGDSSGDTAFSASFYHASGKLMIQPGKRDEGKLLKWLKAFPQLFKCYTSKHPSASGAVPKTTAEDKGNVSQSHKASNGLQPKHQTVYNQAPNQLPQPSSTSMLYANVVRLPPQGQINAESRTRDAMGPVIINEMLCFVQNRLNILPYDIVIKLTSDFFPSDRIKEAKDLLFDSVKDIRQRKINRKGPNKSVEDTKDIATVILSCEVKDCPQFVASDLGNLPPLGAHDFDVVRILQEVETLKQSVNLLRDGQASLLELTRDRMSTQASDREQREAAQDLSSLPPNPQTPQPSSISDTESGEDSYMVMDYTSCSDTGYDMSDSEDTYQDSLDRCEQDDALQNDTYFADALNHTRGRKVSQDWKIQRSRGHHHGRYTSSPAVGSRSSHGTTSGFHHEDRSLPQSHSSKNLEDVIYGKCSSSEIKAAPRSKDKKQGQHVNRNVTGIFITRLDPKLNPSKLQRFIKRETGLNVRPEKLATKYDTYSSYYIPGDRAVRNVLFDNRLWPVGAMIKPFYS